MTRHELVDSLTEHLGSAKVAELVLTAIEANFVLVPRDEAIVEDGYYRTDPQARPPLARRDWQPGRCVIWPMT